MSADSHSAVEGEAWAHDAKSGAVENHAYAMTDSDARTDHVNLQNGGHSNRSPVGVQIKYISIFKIHIN